MSISLIVLGLILFFTALACSYGILARTLIQGVKGPALNRQSISAELREWGASILLVLTYPFGWFNSIPAATEPHDESYPPVILVPGYGIHRLTFLFLYLHLRAKGYQWVWMINHPVFQDNLDDFVDALEQKIEWFSWRTKSTKVDIIAHSMGGIVSRELINRNPDTCSIRKLITLGTPWQGTKLHIFGVGRHVHQLSPEDPKVQQKTIPQVPHLSLWSTQDWIVLPTDSHVLPHLNHQEIPYVGHLSLLASHRVFREIHRFLHPENPDATQK